MSIQSILALWEAGKKAPYSLYDGPMNSEGVKYLVESSGYGETAQVIQEGAIVSQALTDRITAQLQPAPLPEIESFVILYNEDGSVKTDKNGNVVTDSIMIVPEQQIVMLTDRTLELSHEEDMHCDQCGKLVETLFQIGGGWYCKVLRQVNGAAGEDTCFNIRLRQMGVTNV